MTFLYVSLLNLVEIAIALEVKLIQLFIYVEEEMDTTESAFCTSKLQNLKNEPVSGLLETGSFSFLIRSGLL